MLAANQHKRGTIKSLIKVTSYNHGCGIEIEIKKSFYITGIPLLGDHVV